MGLLNKRREGGFAPEIDYAKRRPPVQGRSCRAALMNVQIATNPEYVRVSLFVSDCCV